MGVEVCRFDSASIYIRIMIWNVVQSGRVEMMVIGADLHLAQESGEPVPADPIPDLPGFRNN